MTALVSEPERMDLDLVAVLAALADPIRLAYVKELARSPEWARCGEVLDGTGISVGKSTLSHHLRVLREAGLTHTRIDGTRRFITLRRDDLEACFPGLLVAVCGPLDRPSLPGETL